MANAGCCCRTTQEPGDAASRPQRLLRFASWLLPSIVLAAMPKCPVCVAAYVALFTGCGISIAAAGAARWIVIALCVAALGYLVCANAYKKLRRV